MPGLRQADKHGHQKIQALKNQRRALHRDRPKAPKALKATLGSLKLSSPLNAPHTRSQSLIRSSAALIDIDAEWRAWEAKMNKACGAEVMEGDAEELRQSG